MLKYKGTLKLSEDVNFSTFFSEIKEFEKKNGCLPSKITYTFHNARYVDEIYHSITERRLDLANSKPSKLLGIVIQFENYAK